MKTILLATVENTSLQLLIEVDDDMKTFAHYFLNGIEVEDWSKIKPIYQKVFSALLDDYCSSNKLIKWRH